MGRHFPTLIRHLARYRYVLPFLAILYLTHYVYANSEVDVHWQQGRLRVDTNNQIVVEIQQEGKASEAIAIPNLRHVPTDNNLSSSVEVYDDDRPSRATLPTSRLAWFQKRTIKAAPDSGEDDKVTESEQFILSLDHVLQPGEFVPDVLVALSPNGQRLYWMRPDLFRKGKDSNYYYDTGTLFLTQKAEEAASVASQQKVLEVYALHRASMKFSLPLVFHAIGAVSNLSDSHRNNYTLIFAYNNESGLIVPFFTAENAGRGAPNPLTTTGMYIRFPQGLQIPGALVPARFNLESDYLVVKDQREHEFRFAIDFRGTGGRIDQEVGWGNVDSMLPRWASGREHIHGLLTTDTAQPHLPALNRLEIDADDSISWMSQTAHQRRLRTPKKDNATGAAVLLMGVSKVLIEHEASLRNQALLAVSDAIDKRYTEIHRAAHAYYVQVPPDVSTGAMESLHVHLGNRILQEVDQTKPPDDAYIMIDCMDITDFATVGYIQAFIRNLTNYVHETIPHPQFVVLLPQSEITGMRTWSEIHLIHDQTLLLDAYYDPSASFQMLSESLEKQKLSLDSAIIEKIHAKIMRDAGGVDEVKAAVSNMDAFLEVLKAALQHLSLSTTDPDYVNQVADRCVRIMGKKGVGPFPRGVTRKAKRLTAHLSATSAIATDGAMYGRDEALERIQDRLVTWLTLGYQNDPFLTYFLLGEGGTGKSMTADGLVRVMGGVSETVNFSSFRDSFYDRGSSSPSPSYYGSGYTPRENLLDEIRKKVDVLRASPNPVKILVLDETHARVDMLEKLLNSVGDTDRKTAPLVNFEGIVVVFIMNVDKKGSSYNYLVNHSIFDAEYPKNVFALFTESLTPGATSRTGSSLGPDEKILGAFATRVLPGMIFYAPISTDKVQQKSLALRAIKDFEKQHHVHIIVRQQALEILMEHLARYESGNFRSAGTVLREVLNSAFSDHLTRDEHAALTPHSRYILTVKEVKKGKKRNRLSVELVENDVAGDLLVLEDIYRRFVVQIQHGLERTIVHYEDLVETATNTEQERVYLTNREMYVSLLNAFKLASSARFVSDKQAALGKIPLIHQNIPTIALPKGIDEQQRIKFMPVMQEPIVDIFKKFASPERAGDDAEQDLPYQDILHAAHAVFTSLQQLQLKEQETKGNGPTHPFSDWLKTIVVKDRQNQGRAEEQTMLEAEINFLDQLLKDWRVVEEKLKTQALERERTRQTVEFFMQVPARIHELKNTNSMIDEASIKTNVAKLIVGEVAAYEEVIKNKKDALKNVMTGGSAPTRIVNALPHNVIPIATGYYLDAIIREKAQALLRDMRSEADRSRFSPDKQVAATPDAGASVVASCEDVFTKLAHTTQKVREALQ